MNEKPIITTTLDGSHTLYVPDLDEHYHSTFGAIKESQHIFIQYGLHGLIQSIGADKKSKINILEIGLGTGLNCFLTYLEAQKEQLKVNYTAIEKYPLDYEIARQLNYPKELNATSESHFFNQIHQSEWGKEIVLTPFFNLHKIQANAVSTPLKEKKYDLIYFDAFSPETQPELWSPIFFKKLHNQLNNKGILITYCAKGQVKRDLKSVGFTIENLPGPPPKREITRAFANKQGSPTNGVD